MSDRKSFIKYEISHDYQYYQNQLTLIFYI